MESKLLHNRFEIIKPVAEGGMSRTYLVRDRVSLALRVAKVSTQPDLAEQFLHEYHILADLRHPHLPAVYDLLRLADKSMLFTLDYAGSHNLADLRRDHTNWTAEEFIAVIDQLLSVLKFCHVHGLSHNDLKPENIVFETASPLSAIKLIDFGLASYGARRSGGNGGTLQYAAPEILRKEESDHRADIYALGVILYEMVAGSNPFDDPNVVNVVVNHLEKEITSAPSGQSWMNEKTEAIIVRCLQKDPALRYQSIADLESDFREAGWPVRKRFMVKTGFSFRETEARRLKKALEDVAGFKTPFSDVGVDGDAGSGKTTLLGNLKQLAELKNLPVIHLPVRETGDLGNVARFVRSAMALRETTLPERFADVNRWLEKSDESPFKDVSELFSSLIDLTAFCCGAGVMCVIVDNIDRLNKVERDFFSRWYRRTRTENGRLLCFSFTDAGKLPWVPLDEVRLEPMTSSQSSDLLNYALRTDLLPQDLAERVFSMARGNIFLTYQTLLVLGETGALESRNNAYKFTIDKIPDFPHGLRDFVLSRLTNLSDEEHNALAIASIFQSSFDADAFAAVAESGAAVGFRGVIEKGLVKAYEGRWTIHDAFLRNHVYNSIGEKKRKNLHTRAGAYYLSRKEKDASALAYHLYSGENPEAAIPFLLQAARTDRSNLSLPSALDRLSKAIPLLKEVDADRYLDSVFDAEEIHDKLGDRENQHRLLIEIADRVIDRDRKMQWLIRMANLHERQGGLDEANRHLLEALELSGKTGAKGVGSVYRLLGRIAYLRKDKDLAGDYYERALKAAVDEKDIELQIKTRNSLATVYGSLGNLSSAKEQFEEIESIAGAVGLDEYRVQAALNTAQILNRTRQFEKALEKLAEIEPDVKKTRNRKLELNHARYRGFALLRLRQFEAAEDALRQAGEYADEIDDRETVHEMLDRQGLILARLGLAKQAEAKFREALQVAKSLNHREDVLLYRVSLAHALAQQGRIREGLDQTLDVKEVADQNISADLGLFIDLVLLDLIVRDHFETITLVRFEEMTGPIRETIDRAAGESESLHILALVTVARAFRAARRIEEALKLTDEAVAHLEKNAFYEYDEIDVWHLHYELSAGAQRPRDEVGQSLEKAYTAFKTIEGRLKRPEYRTALANTPLNRAVVEDYKHFFNEERESDIRSFRTLYSIVEDINSILDSDDLFDRIMDSAIEHSGADRGMILLFNNLLDDFEIKVARNMDQETLTDMSHISQSIVKDVFESGRSLVTADANQDERFKSRKSIVAFQIRSVMCVPLSVKTRRLGAVYVDKQFDTHHFTPRHVKFLETFANMAGIAIDNARLFEKVRAEKDSLTRENEELKSVVLEKYEKYNIVGKSKAIRKVFQLIENSADHEATVLIQGESGTGKELVARAIHYNGKRRHKKFIAVDCGALPENLLESELFGYKKGAFTGATSDKTGLFEEADGGTVFLDEISNTSTVLQAKLLRVLQEGEIRRVGETVTKKIDVRIIAATNRQLQEDVKAGAFREDLYYRINVVPIVLPALRERREDVPLLVAFFLDKYSALHKKKKPAVSPELLDALSSLPWEGNIRELENTINRMIIFNTGNRLGLEHLPDPGRQKIGASELPSNAISDVVERKFDSIESMEEHIDRVAREFFQQVLESSDGNKSIAARKLGIKRTTLNDRLKKHGLL